ncbi:MAG: hypothetical protein KJ770_07035 [Actinobacteria bacterium]|nr:hypothetical protein [Actinomycetota bacterium]
MIENIIEQIKTSEEKAKEIIESSKNEASGLLEKAYKDSDATIKESEVHIKEMVLQARGKAAGDASIEMERLNQEFEEKIKKLINDSAAKKEEAINKIINRILK